MGMKRILLVLLLLLTPIVASAQVPILGSTLQSTSTTQTSVKVGCAVGSSTCTGGVLLGSVVFTNNTPSPTTNTVYMAGTTLTWPNAFSAASITASGNITGATLTGTISTASQPNITGLGTVTSGTWSALFGAVSGANLTNITAANVTGSHTLPDGVLSTNVPLINAANVWSNTNTFGSLFLAGNGAAIYIDTLGAAGTGSLNFGYSINSDLTIAGGTNPWINQNGYSSGGTRYRDLKIGDGRGAAVVELTASTKSAQFNGTLRSLGTFDVNGIFVVTAASGNLAINTNKFTVDGATGDTVVAGTFRSKGDAVIGDGAGSTSDLRIEGTLLVKRADIAAGSFGVDNSGNVAILNSSSVHKTDIQASTGIVSTEGGLVFNQVDGSAQTGQINAVGYQLSTTQFRDLDILDGKGNRLFKFSGQGNAPGAFVPTGYNIDLGAVAYGGRATVNGTNILNIYTGTAPQGAAGDHMGSVYVKNVAGSGEVFVMDEAGNATQISPHDPLTNDWVYNSTDTRNGRLLYVKMEQLVKDYDARFGTHFVFDSAVTKFQPRIRLGSQ